MRYGITFALVAAFALSVQAQQPTESSILEMLNDLQVDKLLTQAVKQMNDGIVKAMDQKIQSTMEGRQLTAEQTAAIDKFRTKFSKTIESELSFGKIRGIYVQCYKETFTQQEVDGILAFYNSPSGKAITQKYPQVMQKAQSLMQTKMGSLSEGVGKDMEQLVKDLEKGEAKPASNSSPKKPAGKPTVDTGKP